MSTADQWSLNIDSFERDMLSGAYQAITELNLWDWFNSEKFDHEISSNFIGSPVFSQIIDHEKVRHFGHSGSSFGWVLSVMNEVATTSLDLYNKRRNEKHDN